MSEVQPCKRKGGALEPPPKKPKPTPPTITLEPLDLEMVDPNECNCLYGVHKDHKKWLQDMSTDVRGRIIAAVYGILKDHVNGKFEEALKDLERQGGPLEFTEHDFEFDDKIPPKKGGFAKVEFGKFKNKNSRVAIKIPTGGGDEIEQEARFLMKFNHENIIQLHGLYKDKTGVVGLVLPYVGRDLAVVIRGIQSKGEAVGLQTRLRMLCNAANGIQYIHHQNNGNARILGDIKPDNILVKPDYTCILTDFGTVVAEGTASNTVTEKYAVNLGRTFEAVQYDTHAACEHLRWGHAGRDDPLTARRAHLGHACPGQSTARGTSKFQIDVPYDLGCFSVTAYELVFGRMLEDVAERELHLNRSDEGKFAKQLWSVYHGKVAVLLKTLLLNCINCKFSSFNDVGEALVEVQTKAKQMDDEIARSFESLLKEIATVREGMRACQLQPSVDSEERKNMEVTLRHLEDLHFRKHSNFDDIMELLQLDETGGGETPENAGPSVDIIQPLEHLLTEVAEEKDDVLSCIDWWKFSTLFTERQRWVFQNADGEWKRFPHKVESALNKAYNEAPVEARQDVSLYCIDKSLDSDPFRDLGALNFNFKDMEQRYAGDAKRKIDMLPMKTDSRCQHCGRGEIDQLVKVDTTNRAAIKTWIQTELDGVRAGRRFVRNFLSIDSRKVHVNKVISAIPLLVTKYYASFCHIDNRGNQKGNIHIYEADNFPAYFRTFVCMVAYYGKLNRPWAGLNRTDDADKAAFIKTFTRQFDRVLHGMARAICEKLHEHFPEDYPLDLAPPPVGTADTAEA